MVWKFAVRKRKGYGLKKKLMVGAESVPVPVLRVMRWTLKSGCRVIKQHLIHFRVIMESLQKWTHKIKF